MPPSVSRRSLLLTSGIIFSSSVAGCTGLSSGEPTAAVPIYLENRDDTQHSALIEVHSTTEEEAFSKEIAIASNTITKVGNVTAKEFCIRGRVPAVDNGLDNICPTQSKEDYSQNGYVVVIYGTPLSNDRERQVEIVNIEDADIQ